MLGYQIASIVLLLIPIGAIYTFHWYNNAYTLEDFKAKWLKAKLVAIVIFIIYSGYILFSGYVDEYFADFVEYLLIPGVGIGSIIFAKHKNWNVEGDVQFVGGWCILLYVTFSVVFVEILI